MSRDTVRFTVGSFRVTVSHRPRSLSEGDSAQPYARKNSRSSLELVGDSTSSADPLRPRSGPASATQLPFAPAARGPESQASPTPPATARRLTPASSDPLPASGPCVSRRDASFSAALPQQAVPEPSSSPSGVPEYPLRASGLWDKSGQAFLLCLLPLPPPAAISVGVT